MRVNVSRGLVTALLGIGLLSCIDSSTAPRPMGGRGATFDAVPIPLVITEIMVNAANVVNSSTEQEWIEIYNAGNTDVDISGYTVNSITGSGTVEASHTLTPMSTGSLVVPAGKCIVLADNLVAGATSFANSTVPIAGKFGVSFLNTSGTGSDYIALHAANGTQVDSVRWVGTSHHDGLSAYLNIAPSVDPTSVDNSQLITGPWKESTTSDPTYDNSKDFGTPGVCNYGRSITAGPPAVVTVADATTHVGAAAVQLSASATDVNGLPATTTFTWQGSDESIATVTSDGLATGKAEGSVTITATSANQVVGTGTLVVKSPVVNTITLTSVTPTINQGATLQVDATALDAANHPIPNTTFTWASSATPVATVSASGVVSGVGVGDATITATAGTATQTLTLHVVTAAIWPSTTFVSEIHYDNTGTDAGEAMEIEGAAGSSLDGWSLLMYNGSTGSSTLGVYATVPLSGVIPATCGARGVVVIPFAVNGIQNGDADGWALINAQGQVTELKSYEGTFTALGGLAGGLTSTAINADETIPPPAGRSVQRAGNGVWFGPRTNTFGACNPALPLAPEGTVTVTDGKTDLALGMQTQFFFGGVDLAGQPVASVVWTTSDPTIITVDAKGVVTAKKVGAAKLIATAPDGAFGNVDMTVYLAAGSTGIRLGHNTEFGEPKDADASDDFLIKRAQYTVSYNKNRGGANWVSWNLDASHIGSNGRCPGTCYSADTALTNANITAYTTADWVSNTPTAEGYDRGHMAPSADWTSSEADNNTTFFLSNFLPQRHGLNAGPWEVLENALRDSVSVAHGSREAYIIAGGIFANGVGLGTLLDKGKIGIPDSTWKIAVITPAGLGLNADGTLPANTTVMAVNMPNVITPDPDWHTYLTSVAKIEKSTGYNFLELITESVQCRVEGRNCAPTARITSNVAGSPIVGQPVTFSATTSTDPDEGDVLSVSWSVNGASAGFGETLDRTFASPGSYLIGLTVSDNHGASNSVQTTVTVNPRPAPSCGLGRFENAANFYACDPAPAGYYVAVTDATSPIPCALGYYQPSVGQASCLPAPLGHFVATTGAVSANECAVGNYQDITGQASCKPSLAGSYVSTTGATASTPCDAGTYQPNAGATSCLFSPAGSYVGSIGAAAPTPCAIGFYQSVSGQTACVPAPQGHFVPATGATAASLCAPGSYQDATGTANCTLAPPGRFVSTSGAIDATNCGIGTYSDVLGAVMCTPAPTGHYVSVVGAPAATPCPVGMFQDAIGASLCKVAPPGTFVGSPGASSATNCGLGTYQDLTGQASCKSSPAGSYVSTSGAAAPTPCDVGTYQGNVGQTSCVSSPPGSYVPNVGAASATLCPLGSYQPNTGATSCILAPIASYVAITGATSPTSCPVGMTTNAPGATTLSSCVWLPPAALAQLAADQLQQMITSGQISDADAKPISVSIDQALASIDRGNLTPARNQLGAAENKAQAAVNSGKITAAQAAALIAAIDLAIAHM